MHHERDRSTDIKVMWNARDMNEAVYITDENVMLDNVKSILHNRK